MRFSFQVQQKAAVTLDTPIAAVSRTQYSLHILWVRFSIKNAVRNQGKIGGQEMKHCPYADGATWPSCTSSSCSRQLQTITGPWP
jgi:xanthine dehydrogenase iron-sulfur cluster and FAD-binding subunit A